MNYIKHYILLMRKAERRGWRKTTTPVYVEGHHVFMTSVFGKNDRLAYLTAREHFVAHHLLWKAFRKRYGVNSSKTRKAALAISMMTRANDQQTGRLSFSAREFELIKLARSESMSGDNHWTKRLGRINPLVMLNKDPERAKRLGKLNQITQRELVDSGKHHFVSPEFTERVRQRMLSGLAVELGKKTKGKLWWNNGVDQVRSMVSPGEEWIRGRLPFSRRRTD